MGLTYIQARVEGPLGGEDVQFLVDSGATYSVLPQKVWTRLGLSPSKSMSFRLADGTAIERRISEARFTLHGESAHSPVVLGEPGDEALLGVVTLETLALVLNPFDRSLHPMRMLMA